VSNGLLSWPGVLRVEISLTHGLARVDYDPRRTGHSDLLDAVAGAGDDRHTYQAFLI
jgi:copper chaperone CopZ